MDCPITSEINNQPISSQLPETCISPESVGGVHQHCSSEPDDSNIQQLDSSSCYGLAQESNESMQERSE